MQGNSQVRRAFESFCNKDYSAALRDFKSLAAKLGFAFFEENIRLCEDRLAALGGVGAAPIGDLKTLRVAAIMDEFTFHSFEHECNLLQLRADLWKTQLDSFQPDLIFIESAWRGLENTWEQKISSLSPELLALLTWARSANIPTCFWCKEDPVHFSRFLPVARIVDHVFTTDIDCIPRYKSELNHDRVYLLPFAAQPRLHNPIETFPREDAFCFAGSFYKKYPERQLDFKSLVSVARKLKSLVIYDRNSDRPLPHDFVYPEEYQSELRPALSYAEIDKAYKGYRYGVTVNTIKQSQTMFARRAFELIACNTVVVSNFSRGLRQIFGDLVISSDDETTLESNLLEVCSDDRRYRAIRLLGLRSVLSEHTYAHRLDYIAQKLLPSKFTLRTPKVCVVAETSNADEARSALSAWRAQDWPGLELILIDSRGGRESVDPRVFRVKSRRELLEKVPEYDYVGVFNSQDYYGPSYITDLVLGHWYFDGDGFTKTSYHVRDGDGSIKLMEDGSQYRNVRSAMLRKSLVTARAFSRFLSAEDSALGGSDSLPGNFLSLDEFSYCGDAFSVKKPFDLDTVTATLQGRPPANLSAILRGAEAIPILNREVVREEVFLSLDGEALRRLFPKQVDSRLDIAKAGAGSVIIRSRLADDAHAYIYLSRRFAPSELVSASEMIFKVDAESSSGKTLEVCSVFVFRGAEDQKISQLTDRVGNVHSLRIPTGTDHVRIALRIQGAGEVRIKSLTLSPAFRYPLQAVPATENIVVARGYPAYEDLYRYTFVHARAKAYGSAGKPAHVYCIGKNVDVKFREFEGVDVTDGDLTRLHELLGSGCYRNILVHILDHEIWDIVSTHLERSRVTIWVHGSEIQPWWRRLFAAAPDGSNDWARRTNDARLELWRTVLRTRHRNLRLVFVSRKQLDESLSDLRVNPDEIGNVEVIHNFVNTTLFEYREKPPSQRLRILSVRPFASRAYANDLTVSAICELSHLPLFEDLHFKIVGDGKLFDEIVAPLKVFPNVELHRGFLTQPEIAALHREYGVFLVPTRMDSQGVSRDEAMSSGLVPITNRVAAIPEFVDETSGFLCPPGDASALAGAIVELHANPELFQAMSRAAAARVRKQSSYRYTVSRELSLLAERVAADPVAALPESTRTGVPLKRVGIYGDVNLNLMDGSAIWAASLAEVIGGVPGYRATLILKSRIERVQVIARLLDLAPRVQLVEPTIADGAAMDVNQAVKRIVKLDSEDAFRGIVVRGLKVALAAAQDPGLRGRLWPYLTDIPQDAALLDDESRKSIQEIIAASEFVLCQTPQMQAYFASQFPAAKGKVKIVPPMIPEARTETRDRDAETVFTLAYAGKFAPKWGIGELFKAYEALRAAVPAAELHVFGDKIHKPADAPDFFEKTKKKLRDTRGLKWHGAVSRDELERQLKRVDACWAYRDPEFERGTLELSTKVLEYASLGIPFIVARSDVFETLLGKNYPLFAESHDVAAAHLLRLAREPGFRALAAENLQNVATKYEFGAVRETLLGQGLFS